jgi:hypothetical protein
LTRAPWAAHDPLTAARAHPGSPLTAPPQARLNTLASKRQEVEQRFDNSLYPPCGGDRAAGAPAAEQNLHTQLLEQELARRVPPPPPLSALEERCRLLTGGLLPPAPAAG